jgi:rhodanese-related sulfurtransferase
MGYNNFNMKVYDGEKEYMVLRSWRELGDNEKKQFVDVRNPKEWRKTGVVRGAMLIELDKLDHDSEDKLSQLRKLSKSRLILVNCSSGQRAKLAASILYRHGICSVILK